MASRIPQKLTRKRNALAFEREQLQARARALEEELRGLDYAIRVVDPSWKPPKRASRPRGPFRLPKGKITVETLRTLKERPGLSAPELAEIVAARCALKLATKTEREDFTSSVGMALRRFERRGVLEITEKNARTGALHWRIRPALNKPLFRSAGLNEKLSGVEA
jgi:hypothetical protein